jgi:hypothetical protein
MSTNPDKVRERAAAHGLVQSTQFHRIKPLDRRFFEERLDRFANFIEDSPHTTESIWAMYKLFLTEYFILFCIELPLALLAIVRYAILGITFGYFDIGGKNFEFVVFFVRNYVVALGYPLVTLAVLLGAGQCEP